MSFKDIFRTVNIGDLLLFALLLLAENFTRSVFPGQLHLEGNLPGEEFSSEAFLLIIAGGMTGIICFFFRARGSEVPAKDALGYFSRAAEKTGVFVMSVVISFMASFTLLIIWALIFPGESDSGDILMILLMFVLIFTLPFWLSIRYYRKYDRLKPINPTLRYLLLLPAIFLTTSMMNANAMDLYSEADSSWMVKVLYLSLNFFLLYFAPRMFAMGRPVETKDYPGWILNVGMYFCSSYFGIYV